MHKKIVCFYGNLRQENKNSAFLLFQNKDSTNLNLFNIKLNYAESCNRAIVMIYSFCKKIRKGACVHNEMRFTKNHTEPSDDACLRAFARNSGAVVRHIHTKPRRHFFADGGLGSSRNADSDLQSDKGTRNDKHTPLLSRHARHILYNCNAHKKSDDLVYKLERHKILDRVRIFISVRGIDRVANKGKGHIVKNNRSGSRLVLCFNKRYHVRRSAIL